MVSILKTMHFIFEMFMYLFQFKIDPNTLTELKCIKRFLSFLAGGCVGGDVLCDTGTRSPPAGLTA